MKGRAVREMGGVREGRGEGGKRSEKERADRETEAVGEVLRGGGRRASRSTHDNCSKK